MNRSRDEFFPRSRRSHQQHVGVMSRNFSRKVEHLQHLRAFADDAVEFQVLQQLLFECLHAPPLVVERGHIVQSAP